MRKRRRLIALAIVLDIVVVGGGVYLMRPYPASPATVANSDRVHRLMSREQFDAILAPPTEIEDVAEGGGQIAVWKADEVSVIALFDPDGRAGPLVCIPRGPDGPFTRLRNRLGLRTD